MGDIVRPCDWFKDSQLSGSVFLQIKRLQDKILPVCCFGKKFVLKDFYSFAMLLHLIFINFSLGILVLL